MTARTEMSFTLQEAEPEFSGPSGMSVALIGPNNAHRRIVARGLAGSVASNVREFTDYPGQFSDLPRIVGESYDVVMIDVDSDQSYALALIENITAIGGARVVAYSMRSHPDLEASCLQAGANDFLPLPAEEDEELGGTSPAGMEDAGRSGSAFLYTSANQIAPERNIERGTTNAKAGEAASPLPLNIVRQPGPDAYDFTEWDAKFLRRSRPANVEAPETKPRLAIVPEPPGKSKAQLATDESVLAAVESVPPVVESLPPASESHQPLVESLLPAYESLATAEESIPSADEGAALALESVPPAAECLTSAIESLPPAAEGLSPAVESLSPVVESLPPAVESLAPAVESLALPAENVEPEIESHLRAFEVRPQRITRTLIPIDRTADETLPVSNDEPLPAGKKVEPLLFSSYAARKTADEADDSERPHRNWMRWVLVPAGIGLVAGLFVLAFGPPVRDYLVFAFPAQPAALHTETTGTSPKAPDSKPAAWRTVFELGARNPDKQRPAQQVPSDLMEAQLAAPSRIPTAAKRPALQEEPPAGLVPAAFDGGGSVPGTVFGGASRIKVVPAVSAISAGVAEGLLIHRTTPVYPTFARENNMSGTVTLSATITRTGTIDGLHVLSGPSIFRQAAVDAVNTWRYRPYMLDNQAVEVQTTISVVFKTGAH